MKSPGDSSHSLTVHNRQRFRRLNSRAILLAGETILAEMLVEYSIGIALVGTRSMAEANQRFLQHVGSTDVITFDYGSTPTRLHGDLLISVPDAWQQATEFLTTGEAELLRYMIHGFLHLQGYDDRSPMDLRRMKSVENRLARRHLPFASAFLSDSSQPVLPHPVRD